MKQHLTATPIAPRFSAHGPFLPFTETSAAFNLNGKRALIRILAHQAARACFTRTLQDLADTPTDKSLAKPGAGV